MIDLDYLGNLNMENVDNFLENANSLRSHPEEGSSCKLSDRAAILS